MAQSTIGDAREHLLRIWEFSLIRRPLEILIAIADESQMEIIAGRWRPPSCFMMAIRSKGRSSQRNANSLRYAGARAAAKFDFVPNWVSFVRRGMQFRPTDLAMKGQAYKTFILSVPSLPEAKELARKLVASGTGSTANAIGRQPRWRTCAQKTASARQSIFQLLSSGAITRRSKALVALGRPYQRGRDGCENK